MLIHNAVLTGSLVLPSVLPITGSLIMTGSIGIGTVSPTARLHISGTTGVLLEADGVNGVNALVVSSSGNIGIGTSNPLVNLHIETTGTSTSMGANVISTFRSQAVGRAATIQLSDNTNSNFISSLTGSLGFGSFGNELMRITSTGNVGIGTTVPVTLNGADANVTIYAGQDSSLTLKDAVETWELYCNDDLFITTGSVVYPSMVFKRISGRVGIGTADPRATLQVSNPVAGSPTLPSAGQSGSYTSLYLTNANFQYGMLMGSLPNGNSWIQVQRTDGTATTYDLQLQPNGGSVTAGAAISAGTYLQSNSGIYLTSGAGNNAAIGSTRGGFSTTFALNLASILPGANFASNNYAIWLTIMATNVAIQYNVLVNGSVNTINSAGSNPVTGTSWSGTAAAPVLTFTASTNQYWSAILWCCGT
jgi:hypothetical protein